MFSKPMPKHMSLGSGGKDTAKMSKSIASYPESMRDVVVDRRMRQYKGEEGASNGCGTLAAKSHYDRKLLKNAKPKKVKEAPKSAEDNSLPNEQP